MVAVSTESKSCSFSCKSLAAGVTDDEDAMITDYVQLSSDAVRDGQGLQWSCGKESEFPDGAPVFVVECMVAAEPPIKSQLARKKVKSFTDGSYKICCTFVLAS